MYQKKCIVFIILATITACGGGSDPLTNNDAFGRWSGTRIQAGGLDCYDMFFGAGAGAEVGETFTTVSSSGTRETSLPVILTVEHCYNEIVERPCDTCTYNGDWSNPFEITATTEDTSCAKEVRFTLLDKNEAQLFESNRAPTEGICTSPYMSTLAKQ